MLGVINWSDTYKAAAEVKSKIGLNVDDEFRKGDQQACQQLRAADASKVDQGIDALGKALKIRPEYEDAMSYMNLLYRRKADLECGDAQARAADLKTADTWHDKTIETRKVNADQQQANGIVLDQSSATNGK